MPKTSSLEKRFAMLWRAYGGKPYVAEYVFAKPRRFRFDAAFPNERVAVELEGGIWRGGRHTSGKGFQSDCEKYNLATLMGWRVLRFTTTDLRDRSADVIETVVKALNQAQA